MAIDTLAHAPFSPMVATAFPTAAVEAALRSELIEAVKGEAAIRGVALPTSTALIGKTAFQVDSLVVVSILCEVEPIVGFALPDSVVRAGGYGSVDSALAQLVPRIEAQWKKRRGTKP